MFDFLEQAGDADRFQPNCANTLINLQAGAAVCSQLLTVYQELPVEPFWDRSCCFHMAAGRRAIGQNARGSCCQFSKLSVVFVVRARNLAATAELRLLCPICVTKAPAPYTYYCIALNGIFPSRN